MLKEVMLVGINVTDLARSSEFYRMLGFEIEEPFEFGGEWTTALEMAPNGRGRASIASLGTGMKIELVQWLDPPTEGQGYPTLNHAGICRMHLRTDDIFADYERLSVAGVQFTSEPLGFPGGLSETGTTYWAVFRDPDGTFLELLQA